MSTDAQFMADQIGEKLIGWRITGAIIPDASDGPDQRFGLQVKQGNKVQHLWIDCDAESNGPGWMAIEAAA